MNEYFQASDIDMDLVCDDPLEINVPSWKLSKPVINLSMTSLKKDTTPESVYRQRFFEQSVNYKHFDKIFTDGSLKGEKAAAAAVSNTNFNHPIELHLPNRSSVYIAELRAILLALKHVYQSNSTHSLIISDSFSALQSISSRKITHPILVEIHNLLYELDLLWKTVVFMWVPSHVGIHGNTLVDKAAKDALNHDIPPLPRQSVFHLDL